MYFLEDERHDRMNIVDTVKVYIFFKFEHPLMFAHLLTDSNNKIQAS